MQTVDARGLACPQPVMLTRRAMQTSEDVLTIVDNDVAVANVTRMAQSAGWTAEVERRSDGAYIKLSPPSGTAPQVCPTAQPSAAATGPTVVLLAADTVGSGDDKLGGVLMRAFLHTLAEGEAKPDVIICMNAGVRLAVAGSAVVPDLQALVQSGVQLLLCGTCLDFYHLKEQVEVGTISNMYSISEALLGAGKVVRV